MKLALTILLASCAFSQESREEPTINAETEIRYWRAMNEAQRAAQANEAASKAVQALTQEIISSCGESHAPSDKMDAQGKPSGRFICIPKPKPEPKK